jgi:hypothetical protein
MRYSNSVVTQEDFKRERERRDNEFFRKIERSLNKKWIGYVNGYDTDYSPSPIVGQDE